MVWGSVHGDWVGVQAMKQLYEASIDDLKKITVIIDKINMSVNFELWVRMDFAVKHTLPGVMDEKCCLFCIMYV